MVDRTQSYVYRRVYEEHIGTIPDGYHIHHIDGDHTNNSPENLVALSPEEHYKVHKDQGDWGCCVAMLLSGCIEVSPEERSEISRRVQMKRMEDGTHPFLNSELQRQKSIAKNKKEVEEGRHPFQAKECRDKVSKLQKGRIEKGTWALFEHQYTSEKATQNNFKMLQEGRHPSQHKKECPVCKRWYSPGMFVRWKHGEDCKR
jgi:hypothetical protein